MKIIAIIQIAIALLYLIIAIILDKKYGKNKSPHEKLFRLTFMVSMLICAGLMYYFSKD